MFLCCAMALIIFEGSSNTVFGQKPKPIKITRYEQEIQERMKRKITLDVRDMNIVDIIKFLALKGDFNVVISPSVAGLFDFVS